MWRLTTVLFLMPLLLMHSSCVGVAVSPGLELLESGAIGGIQQRSYVVVRNSGEFQQLYDLVHAGQLPRKELPEVDFSTHMVLIAFAGLRSSTGFSIEFVDIAFDDRSVRVSVVENRPTTGTIQGTVMTSPYAMAKLVRLNLSSVIFVDGSGQVLERIDL